MREQLQVIPKIRIRSHIIGKPLLAEIDIIIQVIIISRGARMFSKLVKRPSRSLKCARIIQESGVQLWQHSTAYYVLILINCNILNLCPLCSHFIIALLNALDSEMLSLLSYLIRMLLLDQSFQIHR